MEGKQDGSFLGQLLERACPACAVVGQVARRRDMGVAVGERSWRLQVGQDMVHGIDGVVDSFHQEEEEVVVVVVAAVEEERGRADGEPGSAVEMVLAAYRSALSCEISGGIGSSIVIESHSAELPGH